MSEMNGKVAIITGGAGGIGKATAKLFIEEGAKVLITDISEEALKEAAKEINRKSLSCFAADVSKPEDNEAMVKKAVSLYGGLDILIANAGFEGLVKPLLEYPPDMIRKNN